MIIYGGKRTGPHGSRRHVFNSSAEVSLSMLCLPKDMCVCMLSHFSRVWLCVTLWTAGHQVPLSMEFSRQEYWSGFSCPPPGDLPGPGIKPRSPTMQADSLLLSHQGSPCKVDSWWQFAVCFREPKTYALRQPRQVGWGGRWEGDWRGRAHVYAFG